MLLIIFLLSVIILISRFDLPWEIVRVEDMADQYQGTLETPEITTSKLGTDMDTELKPQDESEPIKPQETELQPDNPQQPIKENQPPVIDTSKFVIVSIPGLDMIGPLSDSDLEQFMQGKFSQQDSIGAKVTDSYITSPELFFPELLASETVIYNISHYYGGSNIAIDFGS